MTASLVDQPTNFLARWTWALVTSVRFSFVMMADWGNLARFITWWWLNSLSGTTWYCYLIAAAPTLYNIHPGARIARATMTRSGTLVLTTIERVLACLFARIGRVLQYAIATLFITQVSAA